MEHSDTKLLAFAEDPGAANFIGPLVPQLQANGFSVIVTAAGKGAEQLEKLGVVVERVGNTPADAILDKYAPRMLLVGTSENLDTVGLHLISAAKKRAIPSIGVIDGPSNADWRFRGRSGKALAHAPDWILVPDELTRTAYVGIGCAEENVVVVGHPHLDFVLKQRDRLESVGRQVVRQRVLPQAMGRQVVTFAAEISDGLDAPQYSRTSEYSLTGRGLSVRRTEIVLEEVLDALNTLSPRPYFVLRLHPKNAPDEFAAYDREIDFTSRIDPVHDLVFASDLVVGMATHLMVEAAILGCRTLSVLPREREKVWLPTIASGVTQCVTDRSALRKTLPAICAAAGTGVSREALCEAFPFGAIDRASRFIVELASDTICTAPPPGR